MAYIKKDILSLYQNANGSYRRTTEISLALKKFKQMNSFSGQLLGEKNVGKSLKKHTTHPCGTMW